MPDNLRGPEPRSRVSDLLVAWGHGDEAAFEALIPIVHGELRGLARRHMARERRGHTLQPTALVNEVYLRLVDIRRMQWQNRAQFFAMAAMLMRRVPWMTHAGGSIRNAEQAGGRSPSTWHCSRPPNEVTTSWRSTMRCVR